MNHPTTAPPTTPDRATTPDRTSSGTPVRAGVVARTASLILLLALGAVLVPDPLDGGPDSGPPAAVAAQAAEWRWPLAGTPRVTRRFDPPAQRWLPGHRGVDLAGAPGAEVRAAGPGTVYFAGPVAGVPVISIAHAGGLRTTYQPVMAVVTAGTAVLAGDPIGTLEPGHAGCPVEACLHWGLRVGEDYVDPLALLGLARVRLLPHAPPGEVGPDPDYPRI